MRYASSNLFDLIAARARRPEQLAMETSDATSLARPARTMFSGSKPLFDRHPPARKASAKSS